ncbi:MAG: ATP-binding cassette domain-containing protein [Verrucomicrobiota bacterium]
MIEVPLANPPTETVTPLLEVRLLRKGFGSKQVLRDVNFTVPRGGIVSILGRSGTGKSVLLRCIVGLHDADSGDIFFHGINVSEPGQRIQLRNASSYVFQHNALFDSATVLENMLLPLQAQGILPAEQQRDKAMELLRRMELEDASNRFPAELSGGMQKRLAVARALVTDPKVVFFDEPTAGLDPIRRNAVFEMIARLQKERGFTAVVVTHDVQEAIIVSSKIVWLDEGYVLFTGSAQEFASHPEPKFSQFRDNLEALRQSLR